MQSRTENSREIGAVIDDENSAGLAAHLRQSLGMFEICTGEKALVAILQNARSGTEDLFRGVDERYGMPLGNGRIENGIKTRQSQHVLGCRGQYFIGVRIATLGIANNAIGPDQVDGSFDDKPAGAIIGAHLLALIHQ